MQRKLFWAAVFTGSLALAGCNMNHDATSSAAPPSGSVSSSTALSATDLKNTVCPVSGDKVGDSTNVVVYQGKVYHMCCDDCHKDFEKDPSKYAAMIQADPAKYGVKQ
jgi:YHS domain-containing protein